MNMKKNQETGNNEFPLSVDFFDKKEICAVTIDHGTKGLAATIVLVCAIYRNGYYIEWTPENYIYILKELPGVTIYKMQRIVKTLVNWGFFDRTLFEQHQILTNREIQQHYIDMIQEKNLPNEDALPYWLTDENENDADDDTDENDKDGNDCNNDIVSPMRAEEWEKKLLEDQDWVMNMCKQNEIDLAELKNWIGFFVVDCKQAGKDTYYYIDGVKNVFNYWVNTGKIL